MLIKRFEKISAVIAILYLFIGCNVSKKPFYSYITNSYSIDSISGKKLYFFSSILSCGEYLFEFKTKTNNDMAFNDKKILKQTTKYDTTGVYILSAINKQYYEFDTFSLTSNLINKGPIEDKKTGRKISFAVITDSSDTYYGPLKSTLVNNIPIFTAEVMSKKNITKDTFKLEITLIKKQNLNSLYRFVGTEFTDKAYCIMGFNFYNQIKKEAFLQEIKTFRVLTENERSICTSMLKKAGLQ